MVPDRIGECPGNLADGDENFALFDVRGTFVEAGEKTDWVNTFVLRGSLRTIGS